MKVKILLFVSMLHFFFLFLPVGNAANDYGTGTHLLRACYNSINMEENRGYDSASSLHCSSIITGVVDTIMLYEGLLVSSNASKRFICMPKKPVSVSQGTRIVVNYLKTNPNKLHERDTGLIQLAFLDAFPCKKK